MTTKKSIVVILALSFFFVYLLTSNRFSLYYDATVDKRHTLSDDSIDILSKFDSTVFLDIYTSDIKLLNQAKEELAIYENVSGSNLSINYHNNHPALGVIKNPNFQKQHVLIATYKGQQQYIDISKQIINENSLMKMLQILRLQNDKWIIFTSGNGERNPFSTQDREIGSFMSTLQHQGFNVASFELDKLSSLPSNTSILIIAAPTVEFSSHSKAIIEDYLNSGGNLIWLAQPERSNLFEFLTDITGISIQPVLIKDDEYKQYGLPSPTLVIGKANKSHPIFTSDNLLGIFPWTHKLSYENRNNKWKVTPIITGMQEDNIAIEAKRGSQKISVFGGVDFISNGVIENYNNYSLILDILRWQHLDEVPLPQPVISDNKPLVMSESHEFIVKYLFVFIIPLLLLSPIIIHLRNKGRKNT